MLQNLSLNIDKPNAEKLWLANCAEISSVAGIIGMQREAIMAALVGSRDYQDVEGSCGSVEHEAASPVKRTLFVIVSA